MDTNKKVLIGAIAAAVVIGGTAIGFILSRTPEKADLSSIHTEAATEPAKETMAPEPSTEAPTQSTETAPETYTSGKISIQYPAVQEMEDTAKQDQINQLLKGNALSVIKANGLDDSKDSLTVKCKVISADRKRLTAAYTGTLTVENAAHPVDLFYSNTVNLTQVQNIGLSDYTDAYTMAGYVLSDDVEFSGISADVEAQVLEFRNTLDIDTLTAIFDSADFPLASEEIWPESFSYEKQGTIYFSMPVPHAMGDYVIVSFDPSTK